MRIELNIYKQASFFFTEMRISVDNFTSSPRPFAAVLRSRHGTEIVPEIETLTGSTKGQMDSVTKRVWFSYWRQ